MAGLKIGIVDQGLFALHVLEFSKQSLGHWVVVFLQIEHANLDIEDRCFFNGTWNTETASMSAFSAKINIKSFFTKNWMLTLGTLDYHFTCMYMFVKNAFAWN